MHLAYLKRLDIVACYASSRLVPFRLAVWRMLLLAPSRVAASRHASVRVSGMHDTGELAQARAQPDTAS